jgi:hypothetical protein
MSNAEDMLNIEETIEEHKRDVARKNALARLENNPDFKTIITDGFLEKHAIRQVLLKSHPGLQNEAQQKMIDMQIIAIGGLKQFLISVFTAGLNAEESLTADEATLEEMLKEDAER